MRVIAVPGTQIAPSLLPETALRFTHAGSLLLPGGTAWRELNTGLESSIEPVGGRVGDFEVRLLRVKVPARSFTGRRGICVWIWPPRGQEWAVARVREGSPRPDAVELLRDRTVRLPLPVWGTRLPSGPQAPCSSLLSRASTVLTFRQAYVGLTRPEHPRSAV